MAGSVCRIMRFHIGGKLFADHEDVEMEVRKWLGQQLKDFHIADFEALVKRCDKCINVGDGYVEKYIFFPQFRILHFYVLYPFVTYLFSLPRNSIRWRPFPSKYFYNLSLISHANIRHYISQIPSRVFGLCVTIRRGLDWIIVFIARIHSTHNYK
jgi:hypothetical protein